MPPTFNGELGEFERVDPGRRASVKQLDVSTTALELRRRDRVGAYVAGGRQRRQELFAARRGLPRPVPVASAPSNESLADWADFRRGRLALERVPATQYVISLQNDRVIRTFAALLHARGGDERSTLYEAFNPNQAPVMAGESEQEVTLHRRSWIYVVGHGDLSFKTLGGHTGTSLAQYFDTYFRDFGVARIVVIGCLTGSTTTLGQLDVPSNFSQQFHQHLAPRIKTAVTGCNRCILVKYQEERVVEIDCDALPLAGSYAAIGESEGDPGDRLTYTWSWQDPTAQSWHRGF